MKHLWIQGTLSEIDEIADSLRANGFDFKKGEPHELKSSWCASAPFTCPLYDFKPPAIATPQPRPWDAVLGGKR